MSSFSERERGFENYFAHQQELYFQTIALRNKIFAHWVAEQIGLDEELKKLYTEAVIQLLIEEANDTHLLHKALSDLKTKGISITLEEIGEKLKECHEVAREEFLRKRI